MPDRVWSQEQGLARRMQEVAPGEFAQEVYTRGVWDAAVANGRAFIATSERLTTNLTNTHIVGYVQNTSADTLVTLMMLVANIAPDAMVLGNIILNPTGGLPVLDIDPMNMKALAGGGDAPAFGFGVDALTAAPTGGTATEARLTTFKGRNELELGLPLAPGAGVSVDIPLGAVSAGDGSFAIYVVQEPL